VLVLDSKGAERYRIEGYLPKDEFEAQLEMALARIAFKEKRWADAERTYGVVMKKFRNTSALPEAIYWRGVSNYKGTGDHTVLGQTAKELQEKAPDSVWAKRAIPWLA
jgi:outer membrane protein assembly factor BamD (BamD/ComL family)